MTPGEPGEAVTSNRDTLADVIERQGALLSTGSDQQDHFRAVEIADALMPKVEAMLAQARAEVVAAVEAWLKRQLRCGRRIEGFYGAETFCCRAVGHPDGHNGVRTWADDADLAAVSGTDHDTTLDTVRAEALRDAAEEWATGAWSDAFASGDVTDDVSAVQAMEKWLRARADRIAPDDTPSERGGDDAA